MQVNIYDETGDKLLRTNVDLWDAIPDETEHYEAIVALVDTGRYWVGGGAAPLFLLMPYHEAITEPTPIGNQYVIPGCEKDKTRGPVQPDLF